MRSFDKVDKVFIKSNNNTTKIFNRYLLCLIPFLLFVLIYNLIWGSSDVAINLLVNTGISIVVSLAVSLVMYFVNHDDNFIARVFKDNILTIAIVIGLCSLHSPIWIVCIAAFVSVLMRYIIKNITISASLYGILIMLIYAYITNDLNTPLNNWKNLMYVGSYDEVFKSYGNVLSYMLGFKYYLSPILAILSFIYLFVKRSIKYNIVWSYVITFISIMLLVGLFNGMGTWYLLFHICTGNILFLVVFGLSDYPNTPITFEGQILYGVILGYIASILRFIVPDIAVVLTLILGPILLNKVINNWSIKLRSKKIFGVFVTSSVIVVILSVVAISILI